MSKAFKTLGFDTLTVDYNKDLHPDLVFDIGIITPDDIVERLGGRPDVVWCSPDCTTFSVEAISRHRSKNPDTGALEPKSDYARLCDRIDRRLIRLLLTLAPPMVD